MSKQPLPLQLADKVEAMQRWPASDVTCLEVASELRRLHEQNESMREILQRMLKDKGFMCGCGIGNELFDAVEVLLRREMI